MGADGGSIPTRKELVGIKQLPDETTRNMLNPQFKVCSITGKPLDYTQLVCDYHGHLYNKESVLEYLLSKTKSIPQIRTYKDVIPLEPDIVDGRWKCKLSGRDVVDESNATSFACCPCGHVLQASLINEKCPLCSKTVFTPIILYASGNDLARQQKRLHELKKQRRKLKNKLRK